MGGGKMMGNNRKRWETMGKYWKLSFYYWNHLNIAESTRETLGRTWSHSVAPKRVVVLKTFGGLFQKARRYEAGVARTIPLEMTGVHPRSLLKALRRLQLIRKDSGDQTLPRLKETPVKDRQRGVLPSLRLQRLLLPKALRERMRLGLLRRRRRGRK